MKKVLFYLIVWIIFLSSVTHADYCFAAKITASSSENSTLSPQNVFDNNLESRWSSAFDDNQWLQIDFGEIKEIEGLLLYWQEASAESYAIYASTDCANWQLIYTQESGKGGCEEISFNTIYARYIKIVFIKRATQWGYSLYEVCPLGVDFNDLDNIDPGEIISLDGQWFFNVDPKNAGLKEQWFSNAYNIKNWKTIETGRSWEEQGYNEYDGYAWYKKNIFIPGNWADSNSGILFGGIDDAYELFVNGKRVGSFGTMSSETDSVCRTPTSFLLGEYLQPGELNNITLRVFDFWGAGGINERPMFLFQKGQDLKALAQRIDAKSYYQKKARPSQKKYYPQWTGGRQAYWTVVGTTSGNIEATFCEDGMLQLYNQGPSLMPYLYIDEELLTPSDFTIKQFLKSGYLPMPKVILENKKVVFSQEIFAAERNGKSYACLRCVLENKSDSRLRGKVFFTIRPFQVNPPWQWAGGMAEVNKLSFSAATNTIKINESEKIIALKKPDKFDAVDYIHGDIIDKVKEGAISSSESIEDVFNYASGALEYDFSLRGKRKEEYLFIISLDDDKNAISQLLKASSSRSRLFKRNKLNKEFAFMEQDTINYWEEKLNKVRIKIPDEEMLNTIKSSLAYILINKDGPMLQAGSGAYEKSWIRDGCISSAALLRMGYTQEVKDYIDWISGHIKENGKVPPIIISENEVDPAWETVYEEYDSQGQYIFCVLQYYNFTKDKNWLKEKLPVVIRVLDYMESLRKTNMLEEYSAGDKKVFYGIFPLSVSHEGYFPPPGAHSYWDDFWGLKGWKDAQKIAEILGDAELAKRASNETRAFRQALQESISLAQKLNNINYIPGCAERGDFDAPSTAISVWPTEESRYLPQASLYNTFGIFWADQFSPTLQNTTNWSYSSYALRLSHVFILLDQRDKAIKMLEQYLSLKRPRTWNQWAEGTLSDDRKPWFIGDLPHSWVASIYINSFRSMFVYEKDGCLILGHGIPQKWISGEVSIDNFPTYYGDISYSIIEEENIIRLHVAGKAKPPEGFLLKLKDVPEVSKITVNSDLYHGSLNEGIFFKNLPAEINIFMNE
jgi:hypothetical protein